MRTYETLFFEEVIELMASCERLGLPYVVQKEYRKKEKWFGKNEVSAVYLLTTNYGFEEDEDNEETENSDRGQSESEEGSDESI